ncbi:transmembrane protein 276 [Pelodytes ibericus]
MEVSHPVTASYVVLSVVCLSSAVRMLQVHRAAAAGFLLHGLGSAYLLIASSLQAADPIPSSSMWQATITGLPLLAFTFFWMNGDQSTANLLLACGLLLATVSDSLTQESRCLAALSSTAATSLSILVLSVFTGSWYGLVGSVALGTVGLLQAERILIYSKELASNYGQAAAFLALELALRNNPSGSA